MRSAARSACCGRRRRGAGPAPGRAAPCRSSPSGRGARGGPWWRGAAGDVATRCRSRPWCGRSVTSVFSWRRYPHRPRAAGWTSPAGAIALGDCETVRDPQRDRRAAPGRDESARPPGDGGGRQPAGGGRARRLHECPEQRAGGAATSSRRRARFPTTLVSACSTCSTPGTTTSTRSARTTRTTPRPRSWPPTAPRSTSSWSPTSRRAAPTPRARLTGRRRNRRPRPAPRSRRRESTPTTPSGSTAV